MPFFAVSRRHLGKKTSRSTCLCLLDTEINNAFDPNDFLSKKGLEVDVLYLFDPEIDSVLDPVKVDSGDTPRHFASSVEDILSK